MAWSSAEPWNIRLNPVSAVSEYQLRDHSSLRFTQLDQDLVLASDRCGDAQLSVIQVSNNQRKIRAWWNRNSQGKQ